MAIRGSAVIDDFWYYKPEYFEPASGDWLLIDDLHYESVPDCLLGTWNTAALPAGAYRLRLVVVNLSGQFGRPMSYRCTWSADAEWDEQMRPWACAGCWSVWAVIKAKSARQSVLEEATQRANEDLAVSER